MNLSRSSLNVLMKKKRADPTEIDNIDEFPRSSDDRMT
jgi:hypothetical protein